MNRPQWPGSALDVRLLASFAPGRPTLEESTEREGHLQLLREAQGPAFVLRDPYLARLSGEDPRVVARRGEEAGDDQLPDVQAGAGRALLREDLRAGQGLRVQLRQVQAHEAPRDRLREVRRRGDPVQGAP